MLLALALDEVGELIAVKHPNPAFAGGTVRARQQSGRDWQDTLPKFIADFVIRADAFGGQVARAAGICAIIRQRRPGDWLLRQIIREMFAYRLCGAAVWRQCRLN
jgi:hypothetical protein